MSNFIVGLNFGFLIWVLVNILVSLPSQRWNWSRIIRARPLVMFCTVAGAIWLISTVRSDATMQAVSGMVVASECIGWTHYLIYRWWNN